MTGTVVITDPETGAVVDSFVVDNLKDGEVLDAREVVSRVLGIVGDPVALLVSIENQAFRRDLLAHEYDPIFQGIYWGKLDVIAADLFAAAQGMCRAVEARIACEEALRVD